MRKTIPKEGTKETRAEFSERLRGVVKHINKNHDVEGLCKGFLQRLDTLVANGGDRIAK